ncbi:hypothetical protein P2318_25430 [Myxococcaceae bacterium GXIMD 01537]
MPRVDEDIMNRFLGFGSMGLSLLALMVALWLPRETTVSAPAPEGNAAAASPHEVQALEKRVRALEDTAQSLSRRVMAMEQRPVAGPDGTPVAPAPGLAAEVDQLRSEVRSLLAGEGLQAAGGREYLKDAVRTAQEELRAEQRQERQQQWQQNQAQAQVERTERWRAFVSDARLNYTQEQTLMNRLQTEDTKRQALLDEMRAGGGRPQRDVRQELRQLRADTDAEMQKVLSADQQAKYTEMRREENPRGGMRGGGQRGGGSRTGNGPE